jgi:hypothetical protein
MKIEEGRKDEIEKIIALVFLPSSTFRLSSYFHTHFPAQITVDDLFLNKPSTVINRILVIV